MWHNLRARECAAEAQAGSEMAEVEESPAPPAPGLQQVPGELRFAESSHPVVILSPVPAAAATNRSHLPFARVIWGRMEGTSFGDEPRGFSCYCRQPRPVALAEDALSSRPRLGAPLWSPAEGWVVPAGSPRLAAAACGKDQIFTDTFSPNKAVFGSDDTSHLGPSGRSAGEGAGERLGAGKGLRFGFSCPLRCQRLFFKVLGSALDWWGRRGGRLSHPRSGARGVAPTHHLLSQGPAAPLGPPQGLFPTPGHS